MFRLSKDELALLASLESVDSISIAAFADEVILYRGKSVGMYISNYGVVLEPIYAEVMRLGDTIRVGHLTEAGIKFGAYSILTKTFVIPILHTLNDFWIQYHVYDASLNQNTDL